MNNIITVEQFAKYRALSVLNGQGVQKAEEAITMAQQGDLLSLMGGFLYDVVDNIDSVEYADLLNGSRFEYSGRVYYHQGIRALLADYAYSRYIYNINVNITPFGAVTKSMQDSTAVERNMVKDLSEQARQDGGDKWEAIEVYLRANQSKFSRYFSQMACDPKISTFKTKRLTTM